MTCNPPSFQLLVYSNCSLLIITTNIMHGMQGQYSRVPMPYLWSSLCHVYTLKSEYCKKTWPQGSLHFLGSARSSCRTGDLNSFPPDLELGALTKWLASRCCSLSVLAGFSTKLPQYHVGVLHLGVEKWRQRVCHASEPVSDVPSCQHYTARQSDMIMWSRQPHAQTSRQGHHCRKTWPKGSFHFLVSAPSSCPTGLAPQGIWTHVLQIWS